MERRLEGQRDVPSEVARSYCLAVHSALTDDGRPPLAASGLKLKQRLEAFVDSLERVREGQQEGQAERQGQGG
jgi:hypothetical protein